MHYTIACSQHSGRDNRFPQQQDSLWNGETGFQKRNLLPQQYVAHGESLSVAVADGVGCSPRAELASLCVLQALASESPDKAFDRGLVWRLQEKLCKSLARGATCGSSTTLAAVRCYPDHCEVLNAGDSRVYRISAAGVWQQLSHDHSLINSLIEQGEAEEGVEYASFYYSLDSCLVADGEESEFAIHRRIERMAAGDTLLLCTDGVHDTLSEAQLQSLYSASLSPKEQAQVWRDAVLAAGAPDNLSLIVLRYDAPGGEQSAGPQCTQCHG